MIDNSFCACHWMSPIFKMNIFHFPKLHFQVKQINGDMGYGPPILQIINSQVYVEWNQFIILQIPFESSHDFGKQITGTERKPEDL